MFFQSFFNFFIKWTLRLTILPTHHGSKINTIMRNKELISQPTVLRIPLEKPPVNDKVPVCTKDHSNGWCNPRYYPPTISSVKREGCPGSNGYNCWEIFQPIESLHKISLFVQASETLKRKTLFHLHILSTTFTWSLVYVAIIHSFFFKKLVFFIYNVS